MAAIWMLLKNWQIESEKKKQNSFTFCTNLPKKDRGSISGNVTLQWP